MRSLIVLVALASQAHAGGIVIESYTGDRPADAPRLVKPIFGQLVARSYNFGDTLARRFEQSVSRAALTPEGLPADFAAQVDGGFKAWVGGRFDEAVKTLGQLVDVAHANSGAFARDQSLREPLQKALIALALSHQRRGDEGAARATFGELARAFPDATVSRAMYGAEAFDLFDKVRHELGNQGTGKLAIKLSDDTGVVFIDEQYRNVGSTTLELPPGEYRVCVLLEKEPSRTHVVTVRAKATATIAIDPHFDRAVRTAPWVGLEFASAADREAHEGAYAAAFANAIGATAIAVVGVDQVRGRPAVVGSLVSLQSGRDIRRASVAMDPDPSVERLQALGGYLAGEEPAAGIDVQATSAEAPVAHAPERDEPAHARWGGWKWLAVGVGVGALATGGVLVALDGRCKGAELAGHICNDEYATASPGYVFLGVGAAAVAVSIYLFATTSHETDKTAFVAPANGGATFGIAGRF